MNYLKYDPDFEKYYDQFIHETDISKYGNAEELESFIGKAARLFYKFGKNEKEGIKINIKRVFEDI